ncbi:MAG: transposase [Methanosarcinaceae archaeon]|nr:transposase [Methanosarcinaceae archaeon]
MIHARSQKCISCGTKVEKSLSTRIHYCHHHGLVLDIDHNAAIYILNLALGTTVNACGLVNNGSKNEAGNHPIYWVVVHLIAPPKNHFHHLWF